jgi:hypothetical protein
MIDVGMGLPFAGHGAEAISYRTSWRFLHPAATRHRVPEQTLDENQKAD